MNLRLLTHLLAGLGLGLGATGVLCAAETQRATTPTNAPAAARLSPQEFQARIKEMTPEQRQAAIREYREQQVREAQQRPRVQQTNPVARVLAPEAAEARLKQMRAQLEARVADLEKRKAAGTLTPLEETQLEKLQAMLKRAPQAFTRNPQPRELRPPDSAPKAAAPRTNRPPAGPASRTP